MAQRGSPETVKRKELVGKLNPVCLKAFSAAAQTAKARGNPYVELVHFIEPLSRSERSDFEILCQSAGVDAARLEGDVARALDRLPPERREALLLIGASGFSYEEAAQVCGVAIGTMKSRVARGRAQLGLLLSEGASSPGE